MSLSWRAIVLNGPANPTLPGLAKFKAFICESLKSRSADATSFRQSSAGNRQHTLTGVEGSVCSRLGNLGHAAHTARDSNGNVPLLPTAVSGISPTASVGRIAAQHQWARQAIGAPKAQVNRANRDKLHHPLRPKALADSAAERWAPASADFCKGGLTSNAREPRRRNLRSLR